MLTSVNKPFLMLSNSKLELHAFSQAMCCASVYTAQNRHGSSSLGARPATKRRSGRGVIRVYNGTGATSMPLVHMFRSLQTLCGDFYNVLPIDAKEIRKGALQSGCDAVVFGGGAAGKVVKALDKEGALRIRDYVLEGGTYFGVCAGAYLASSFVVFQFKGDNNDVTKLRPLGLFPGVCAGPLNANFRADAVTVEASSMYLTTSFLATPIAGIPHPSSPQRGAALSRYVTTTSRDVTAADSRDVTATASRDFTTTCDVTATSPDVTATASRDLTTTASHDVTATSSCDVTAISRDVTTIPACFAGGGAFYEYPSDVGRSASFGHWTDISTETLAYCPDHERAPAVVVKTRVGKGIALLSSPHLEWPLPVTSKSAGDDVVRMNLLGALLGHGGLRTRYVTRPLMTS